MTEFHIRGLDPDVANAIKAKAKANGRSVNAEINRLICEAAVMVDREPLPTAVRAIEDRAIRSAVRHLSQAPANATAQEKENTFWDFLAGFNAAVLAARDNGADVDEIAAAIGADVQGAYFRENPEPANRTATLATPDWDVRTGLSIGVVDRT